MKIITSRNHLIFQSLILLGITGQLLLPVSASAQLAGTYTIGSGGSFSSFTAAVNALNTQGVSGAVTFNVISGTYTEQISIQQFPGSSASHRVTFQAQTGNAADVILQFAPTSSNNYIVRLNGADYVTFEDLTFTITGTTYGTILILEDDSDNDQVKNCILYGVSTATSNSWLNIVHCQPTTTPSDNFSFIENTVFHGSDAIYYRGVSTSNRATGLQIISNTFNNVWVGINITFQIAPMINSNIFLNQIYNAINCNLISGSMQILKNQIKVQSGSGIYLSGCHGGIPPTGTPGLIANNFVTTFGDNSHGIYSYSNSYQNFYYNSVQALGANYSRAFEDYSSSSNINIVNNNLCAMVGGYALYISHPEAIGICNFNNLYTPGTFLASWNYSGQINLTALQAASGKDANSRSVYPHYAPSDLHTIAPWLDGAGTILSEVTDDIDGEPRGSSPDIGADQFVPDPGTTTALSGTFTIGSGGSYANLQEAANDLTLQGINGPITLNILSSTSSYQGQVMFLEVPGASSTNTITIQSQSGNPADVNLYFAPSSSANNYILNFYGADFFRVRNLTLTANQNTSPLYGRIIELFRGVDDIIIEGNNFNGSLITNTSNSFDHITGLQMSSSHSTVLPTPRLIRNNTFTNGSAAVYLSGFSSDALSSGTEILHNTLVDVRQGIELHFQLAPEVSENVMDVDGDMGLTLGNVAGALKVIKNKIVVNNSFGLRMMNCEGGILPASDPGLIANNFISLTSTGTGIVLSHTHDQNFCYNSVNIVGQFSHAFDSGSSTWNLNVWNNIFTAMGGGYSFEIRSPSSISSSHHNDHFTTGPVLARWALTNCSTLVALQSISGQEYASVSVDPGFVSNTDLHVSAPALDSAATPLNFVLDDIDGEVRNLNYPDIGADEFGSVVNQVYTALDPGLPGASYGSVEWADYDDDRDLDIFISGQTGTGHATGIFKNTNGIFSQITANLRQVANASAAWGDYDNDSDLDLLVTGLESSTHYTDVYRNDNGTFNNMNLSLTGVSSGSANWVDYDNDGDLDIFITGVTTGGRLSRLYRNDHPQFSAVTTALPNVQYSASDWGDFDQDGDLDLLLAGNAGAQHISRIYRNNGKGGLSEVNAGLTGVYNGDVAWGDYDADGDLDILVSGHDGSGPITRIYRNDGNEVFTSLSAGLPGIYQGESEWGDYDSDGDLDILLIGLTASAELTAIYENDGSGNFSDMNAGLQGMSFSSAAAGDYDNDHDLDILVTGMSGGGPVTLLYRNDHPTVNQSPGPPQNLSIVFNDTMATFSWDPASDPQTPTAGLNYNLRLGTTPGGSEIVSAMADSQGYRKIVQRGNIRYATSWTIRDLTPGQRYYWSVQTIDPCFEGSAFSSEWTFITSTSGPFTEIESGLPGVFIGEAAWGDCDNDGDLDILITGAEEWTASVNVVGDIYLNDGLGNFTLSNSGLPHLSSCHVAWGDCDNDNDLDIVLSGWLGPGYNGTQVNDIYLNDGQGHFTPAQANLPRVLWGSVCLGDCDNDGDLDLLLTGTSASTGTELWSDIYLNDGKAQYTRLNAGLTPVTRSSGIWGDIDNDGDQDILLSGLTYNNIPFTDVYFNEGESVFIPLNSPGAELRKVSYSSAAWGDFSRNGFLDLFINGTYNSLGQTRIYFDTDGSGFHCLGSWWEWHDGWDSDLSVGDYDNDGDLDLLNTGDGAIYENSYSIFRHDITFLAPYGLQYSSASWGDLDNDNDLDFIVTGDSVYGNPNPTPVTKVYRNNCPDPNTPPTPPTVLSNRLVGQKLILEWDSGWDPETYWTGGLTYNLRLGNTSHGSQIKSPMAAENGWRRIPAMGNVNHALSWPMELENLTPHSSLYWSVQSIDPAYAGSVFSPEDSICLSGKIRSVKDVPNDQGGRVTITWSASELDQDLNLLQFYSIWRAIPATQKLPGSLINLKELKADYSGPGYRLAIENGDTLAWEWITNQPAHRLPVYSYTCSTLFDSMSTSNGMHYFMVSAHTSNPNAFFNAVMDSGYSVDNLAPASPQNLVGTFANGEVYLHWQPVTDLDLRQYLLYRSLTPNINPAADTAFTSTTDTALVDGDPPAGGFVYYIVIAQDIHDNLSDPSNEISVAITGITKNGNEIPLSFNLYQNYPNPFNPHTTIQFDLPQNSLTEIRIYNSLGEQVEVLVNQELAAGKYRYYWIPQGLASGIYFYTIQADNYRAVKKMILMK